MDISRNLVLFIFGLKDDYTKKELSEAYHHLAKLTHPDSGGDNNLFVFIKECKNVLDNKSQNNSHSLNNSQNTSANESKSYTKEKGYISLDTLYSIYYDLDDIMQKYDIDYIETYAKIYILPYFKQAMLQNFTVSPHSYFSEFLNFNRQLIDFSEIIYLPEDFKKFKFFKIRVIFRGYIQEFVINIAKNSVKQIKVEHYKFDSILNLSFKFKD